MLIRHGNAEMVRRGETANWGIAPSHRVSASVVSRLRIYGERRPGWGRTSGVWAARWTDWGCASRRRPDFLWLPSLVSRRFPWRLLRLSPSSRLTLGARKLDLFPYSIFYI